MKGRRRGKEEEVKVMLFCFVFPCPMREKKVNMFQDSQLWDGWI